MSDGSVVSISALRDRGPLLWDEDAEMAVLSAALFDERAFGDAAQEIGADDFYAEKHRRIFRAMGELSAYGSTIDPVTVADVARKRGELESVGGKEYLGFLVDAVPTAANVRYHARIVREKSARRQLVELSKTAIDAALNTDRPVAEIAAQLQLSALPLSIINDRDRTGFVRIGDEIFATVDAIGAAARGERARHIVPTGFPEIDENISGGIERGQLFMLASVPAAGKSAVAMNFMLSATTACPAIGALFVSAEMTRAQVNTRLLANVSHVPFTAIRRGSLNGDHCARIARGAEMLLSLPLWTDETPTPNIGDIIAKCRARKAEHPEIGLVVVDFIQLVQNQIAGDRRMRDENRSAELSKISYALQALAKELDVAVIATCQVDAAAIEQRTDKRPKLGDARWSQGMREAAHLFATAYRPKMYDETAPDTIELSFLKCRDDSPFVATLDWRGAFMQIRSRSREGSAGNSV